MERFRKIGKLFLHTFQNIAHLLAQKENLATFEKEWEEGGGQGSACCSPEQSHISEFRKKRDNFPKISLKLCAEKLMVILLRYIFPGLILAIYILLSSNSNINN